MVDLGGLADKAKKFLNSDKGEQISDSVLEKGSAAANKLTGGKHDSTIRSVRDKIDGAVGTDGRQRPAAHEDGRPDDTTGPAR